MRDTGRSLASRVSCIDFIAFCSSFLNDFLFISAAPPPEEPEEESNSGKFLKHFLKLFFHFSYKNVSFCRF